MFVVTVEFRISPGSEEAFGTRVRQQAADSLALEPACRRFDVLTDPEDAAVIFLYEVYDDAAAFEAHLATSHFRAFDADIAQMVSDRTLRRWRMG